PGLTLEMLPRAPRISARGTAHAWRSPLPAVTATCQATMLTGLAPAEHGIVGNGWLFRETGEVRFWQQSRQLIEGSLVYAGIPTAKVFWWFAQGDETSWYVTPKPHYGADGSKVFDIIDATGCDLEAHAGKFPFHAFWGPAAGWESTDWISRAAAHMLKTLRP